MKITAKFQTAPGGRYDTLEIAILGREARAASFWLRNFYQETYHCAFELDTAKLFKAESLFCEAQKLAEFLMEGLSLAEGEGSREAKRTEASKTAFLQETADQFSSGQEVLRIRVSQTCYRFAEEMDPEEFLPEGAEFAEEDWQTYEYFERCEEYVIDLKSKKTEFVTRSVLHTEKE